MREGDRHILVYEDGETVEDAFDIASAEDSIKAREDEKLILKQTFDRCVAL